MVDVSQLKLVHVVGIGGAGMSAIARILHGKGIEVSGSDLQESPILNSLRDEGICVTLGHTAQCVGKVDLVLASSAIPDDNVELIFARESGIPVQTRPEFLTDLTAGYDVIAVAGAHGKTTVTAMLTQALIAADLDPTFIIGGVATNLNTNAHCGSSSYFVIEADEYRNTFLALSPKIAVITNIEYDHPDCFPSMGHVRLAFGKFADNIRTQGLLVACYDDRVGHVVAASYHASGGRVVLYGSAGRDTLEWQAHHIAPNASGGMTFSVTHRSRVLGEVSLQIPGDYNALNALAVIAVATELGIPWETVRDVLAAYQGTARRFEYMGEQNGIVVIDDYAHHPTQIAGVIKAAQQRYPGRRIIAAWEPHTFSRIKALYGDFMGAFTEADAVVILPIYAAREEDDESITVSNLKDDMQHPKVSSANSLEHAVDILTRLVAPGDVVVMMGAGKEYVVGQSLLAVLGES
ncbi:MAG: UDP-N-acetylmuramate--L-alanine ligase [Anaerolineae bacterium]|nr:UDP-N-acetylmuramate--L-alanine ligase [Anaerolineae bacterium]